MLTGGGAQLKHIKQLVEYITGMDTRIGYPNEHLAGNSDEEISSPLYATVVGLVMKSIKNNSQSAQRQEVVTEPKMGYRAPIVQSPVNEIPEHLEEEKNQKPTSTAKHHSKKFL